VTRTPFKSKITCNGLTSNEGKQGIGESTPKVDGISCSFCSPRIMNLATPLLPPPQEMTHQLLKKINIEELGKSTS
jgi:hypothetical protein